MRLVVGMHGTTVLVDAVKSAIRAEWLRVYGIDEAMLDDATKITLDFALGGLTSIWADTEFDDLPSLQRAMAESGIVFEVIGNLRERFSALAR